MGSYDLDDDIFCMLDSCDELFKLDIYLLVDSECDDE